MNRTRLVVFAKAPHPGRVKTRLSPPLKPAQASAVHEASLRDVVAAALSVHPEVHIRHDGARGAAEWFAEAFPAVSRSEQGEGDLGERLARTFDDLFRDGAPAVVIVGSDSPTLPAGTLARGVVALLDLDVVLGPAHDGGYYLIGLHRRAWPRGRSLLVDIPWSTDRVLGKTLERIEETALRSALLDEWYDIDRIHDLERAARDASAGSHLGRLLEGELSGVPGPGRAGAVP